MTTKVQLSFENDGYDTELHFDFNRQIGNVLDYSSLFDPHTMSRLLYRGNKKLQSDGLQGVIADGIPTSATVVLIQEHQGHYIEVGRMATSDGSWNISGLQDKPTHAIALKQGFNAGITAYITPED